MIHHHLYKVHLNLYENRNLLSIVGFCLISKSVRKMMNWLDYTITLLEIHWLFPSISFGLTNVLLIWIILTCMYIFFKLYIKCDTNCGFCFWMLYSVVVFKFRELKKKKYYDGVFFFHIVQIKLNKNSILWLSLWLSSE